MTSTAKDLSGRVFDYLTVVERNGKDKNRHAVWRCQCICGQNVNVTATHLLTGHTKSCGCEKGKMITEKKTKHGHSHRGSIEPLYKVWSQMKERCNNPHNHAFPRYGDRGLVVCYEWNDSYQAFKDWCLENGYLPGLCIHRIDNEDGYYPKNCTFLPRAEHTSFHRRAG
jgi:hypothetical protein